MRETQWPPARGRAGILIDGPRLQVRALDGLCQTLISGDLEAAVAALAPGAPTLGLYALLPAGAHALRIGRMSALLVTSAAYRRPRRLARRLVRDERRRWLDRGRGLGRRRAEALMQATSADLAAGSPSAAVLVFGLRALLARTQAGFRLHVEAPWLETLLAWLDGV